MIKFVLVNNRVPARDPICACCGKRLESGYIRATHANLKYCNLVCYGYQPELTAAAAAEQTRRVS